MGFRLKAVAPVPPQSAEGLLRRMRMQSKSSHIDDHLADRLALGHVP
jgi:hypothetical protein